jgi:hypothetical protein
LTCRVDLHLNFKIQFGKIQFDDDRAGPSARAVIALLASTPLIYHL